jgi:hypothetical protein
LNDLVNIRKKYEREVKKLKGDVTKNLDDLKRGIADKIITELYGN